MKQKLNVATWWRTTKMVKKSIKIAFWTTKMAPPGGEIKFVVIEASIKFCISLS